ncbi:MAG: hypothetical protein WC900_08275 [Oscillospiraceae bacterium]|jgi:hypothetical protein
MKTIPRGLKNNNPLNIRKSNDTFIGELPVSTDKAFKQFKSIDYGYRAAFVTLATYNIRGANTIEKIVSKWAPPSDGNHTENYIKNVSARSGIDRNKILSMNDGAAYIKIVAAMSFSENGIAANMEDVIVGFNLQGRIKA